MVLIALSYVGLTSQCHYSISCRLGAVVATDRVYTGALPRGRTDRYYNPLDK